MEEAILGNNTVTVCPNCDELISVKGVYSIEIETAIDEHMAKNAACQAYQDSLPTLAEFRGIIPRDNPSPQTVSAPLPD